MSTQTERTGDVVAATLDAMRRVLRRAHTMLPCRIVSYNAATQTATVRPVLKRTPPVEVLGTAPDGTPDVGPGAPIEYPDILGVPVYFPRVGIPGGAGPNAYFYLPVKPDSLVMCLFADASLDKWKLSGGVVDPQSVRAHALSDAVALPGLYPFNDPIPNLDPSDIRIVLDWPDRAIHSELYLGGDTGDIVAAPSNKVMLGSAAPAEKAVLGDTLKAELETLMQSMVDNAGTFVNTGAGPGSLNPLIATALTTFIANLINTLSLKVELD